MVMMARVGPGLKVQLKVPAKSLELHRILPHEWRGPKYLGNLPLWEAVGTQTSDLTLDANQTDGGLAHCTTDLARVWCLHKAWEFSPSSLWPGFSDPSYFFCCLALPSLMDTLPLWCEREWVGKK